MRVVIIAVCFLITCIGTAQPSRTTRYISCDTKPHDSGYYMLNAQEFVTNALSKKGMSQNGISTPYTIRTFIRIARENNGTLPGCTIETALQNFNEMNGQYNAHNICFQLIGIDYVNDSYLNNFDIDANLASVYPAYIRNNNLDIDGAMTIFIHNNYLGDSGSSGKSYGIPNNFVSIARWAVNSPGVRSIFGHEIGHALGLYHTFETGFAYEPVKRTFEAGDDLAWCSPCNASGDLCCDTPADYDTSRNFTNGACVYNGLSRDWCKQDIYTPSTINIMSYMPWGCISITGTALTPDQRTRMHATILGPIASRVAEDELVLQSSAAFKNEVIIYSAKNNVTTASGANISNREFSKAYYVAGNSIVFGPGVTFAPSGAQAFTNAAIVGCP
jgi:hypothetical protein